MNKVKTHSRQMSSCVFTYYDKCSSSIITAFTTIIIIIISISDLINRKENSI